MIFIIGCHRSGTSILSRLVHGLLRVENTQVNQHYEDKAIVALNEWLLRRAGGSWEYIMPLINANAQLKSTIDEAVEQCFMNNLGLAQRLHNIGLIKDPRLCATWTNYLSVFQDIKIIHISRDPVAVAKSLHKRYIDHVPTRAFNLGITKSPLEGIEQHKYFSVRTCSLEGALEIVTEYTDAFNQSLTRHEVDTIAIRYEELTAQPEIVLRQLSHFLGATPSPSELEALQSLIQKR